LQIFYSLNSSNNTGLFGLSTECWIPENAAPLLIGHLDEIGVVGDPVLGNDLSKIKIARG
jgi:hypothetical protein